MSNKNNNKLVKASSRIGRYKLLLPDEALNLSVENFQGFYKYIYERQMIYHKRFELKENPPWTKDPFMKNRKFCNVYRELDYTSLWLINKVCLDPNKSDKTKFFQIILFRYLNKVDTFEKIGLPTQNMFVKKDFLKDLDKLKAKGENPFTNAYMINPPKESDKELGIYTRNQYYAWILGNFQRDLDDWFAKVKAAKSFKEVCKVLTGLRAVSWFLAYQFAVDLTYAKVIPFSEDDWAFAGKGAMFGLRLIFPNMLKEKRDPVKLMRFLRDSQDAMFKKLGVTFPYPQGKRLTLMSIENCLCEYSKYWKMNNEVGKQRLHFQIRTKSKSMPQVVIKS